jgi:hypothetical protein
VKILSRICSSCDVAALDITHVAVDGPNGVTLVELAHCRLCDGRRCRRCRTPASAASEAMAMCHYCAAPISPLGSAA